jgi:uncharacterized membrane-anchored protein YhcB (DUF1043 family)
MHIALIIVGIVVAGLIALTIYNYQAKVVAAIKADISGVKTDLETFKAKVETDAKAVVTDAETVAKKI